MLIPILIILFIILIFYQIFLAHIVNRFIKRNIIEGMDSSTSTTSPTSQTYQPYDLNNPNNTLILAQQNAGNIQVLKQQIDKLLNLNTEVQDISGNLATLNSQVSTLIEQQQQYAQANIPSSTPNISGSS